jgi:exopolysaccharide biosynthesis protein
MKKILLLQLVVLPFFSIAQVRWINIDSMFAPLPAGIHVYRTTDPLDGKPNIAYYVEADLKNKNLQFTVDTTHGRRLKPSQYYEKNNKPLLVVNTTFFSFATNQNLNAVIKDGQLVGYNIHTLPGRGKDTLTYRHTLGSVLGISKKREADIAWLYTDSSMKYPIAFEKDPVMLKDSNSRHSKYTFAPFLHHAPTGKRRRGVIEKWKMQTAVGGGPVLMHHGEIRITNNEEYKFINNAIADKHPRTAMGYTRDNKLIILVVEGRHPGIAEGATLIQQAQLFKDLGCCEALNLDGGGSSCMLVNGKETIKVSDAGGQRPVPAVFIISSNN